MSRNKDIEFLHDLTGEPYSKCRRVMKACKWELFEAYGALTARSLLNTSSITDALQSVVSGLEGIGDALRDNLKATFELLGRQPAEELARILSEDAKNG